MKAMLHSLTFSGDLLQRGFWLYVWEITTAQAETVLYVGRTGDEASPNAQSPFNRVGQHLGANKNANALRRNLADRGIDPTTCTSFEMIAYGPIFPEAQTWEEHHPFRDKVAAAEKALRDALAGVGYDVLNQINCGRKLDPDLWEQVQEAFAERFPMLKPKALAEIAK